MRRANCTATQLGVIAGLLSKQVTLKEQGKANCYNIILFYFHKAKPHTSHAQGGRVARVSADLPNPLVLFHLPEGKFGLYPYR